MLYRLEQALVNLFVQDQSADVLDVSALNVAMFHITRLPYFQGAYDHHALMQRSDTFYQLHVHAKQDWVNCDPLTYVYDQGYGGYDEEIEDPKALARAQPFRVECPVATIQGELVVEGPIHAEVARRAQGYVDRLAQVAELAAVFAPTPSDMSRRARFEISKVAQDDLPQFLKGLLGEGVFQDHSLKRCGIQYHNPSYGYSPQDKTWNYLVAHNANEVAGVLGFTQGKQLSSLSYVSVGPGFQRQGLSKRLYQRFIDEAIAHNTMLVRSSPSEFTLSRPGITHAYDNMVLAQPVLHVASGGYLHKAITDAMVQVPYHRVFREAKSACDELLRAQQGTYRSSFSGPTVELDSRLAKRVRESFSAPAPRPALKR